MQVQIEHLHLYCGKCHHPGGFRWHVGPIMKKGEAMPLDVTLTNEEKVLVHANPMTAAGHPAQVDGVVEYVIDSGACTIMAGDDSLSAWIVSGDTAGDSVVRVRADADLGAGVVLVEDLIMVHVSGANAASFGLQAEAPVLK